MNNTWYYVVGVFLIVIPLLAAWRKRWWVFALYTVGSLIFASTTRKGKEGWDALADFATLIIIVIPIYIIATIVWVAFMMYEKQKKKNS